MESPGPGRPSRETGLPPGVELGSLGRRFVAYLIEWLVPGIVIGVLAFVLPGASGTVRGVLSIVGALVVVTWAIIVIYLQAEKAAGPGMRLMKLQLVGFYDGRPIGWGRVLLRTVILILLTITGVGLVIMLIALVTHPRRQGWHDRAAKAVVIKERVLAPPVGRPVIAPASTTPQPAREPTYGPVARYSPVPGGQPAPGPAPGGQPAPGPAPARLTPPTGTGYPPTGYPSVGYPPGADPRSPGGYPPRAPDPYPPVQPIPAPAVPTVAPAVAQPPASTVAPPASPPSGFPAASPVPTSAPSPPTAESAPLAESPAPVLNWVAVLDDGRRLTVERLVLLGRNPRPQPGEEDAQLVKLADETRTVSKLHLAIGVDEAGLYVVDRGSTNGSTVTNPGGASQRCRPGDVVYVVAGSIVSMGDHWLEIRREEAR